ncbi:MAG TPA: hypothetical protein VFF65_05635, partial [Phycisphaerales bacterium]|nr:hypothetical protein [Phycisphaerales bacterium]
MAQQQLDPQAAQSWFAQGFNQPQQAQPIIHVNVPQATPVVQVSPAQPIVSVKVPSVETDWWNVAAQTGGSVLGGVIGGAITVILTFTLIER